ncbi:MAG TPA: asparagine synthase-related protein [Azospirillum sp.]
MARIAGVAGHQGAPARDLPLAMLRAAGLSATVRADGLAGSDGASLWDDGRIAVLLDGCVYNAEELPEPAGPDGDAGRIAAAVSRYGVAEALRRVNGDFAVAVLDRTAGTLHLARDRFGVRPLYYAERGGALAFASRPRALFAVPGVAPQPRRAYVAAVAAANYRFFDIAPEASPYEGIGQLPGGHLLTWSPSGVRVAPYASFTEEEEFERPLPDLIEEYRALVRDAVGRRLKRAARPAFTLSGGLDSSTVVTNATLITGRPQSAVSTVYSDAYYDESREIRDVIDAGIAEWMPIRIDDPDLFALIGELVALHDEPVATVTWMTHYLLSREVRARGFDALFGGLGGDEQHAGEYDYFFYFFADLMQAGRRDTYEHEVGRWIHHHDHPVHRKTPEVAARMMATLTDPAVPGQCRPNTALLARYHGLVDPAYFDTDTLRPSYDRVFSSYLKSHTLNELTRNTMPCCLRASDRNTAAFGLGDFFPMLDHRLFEFMFRIPVTAKIRDGVTKWFLRQSMEGILPEATRTRVAKTGWNAPAHRWFAEGAREDLLDLVRSRRFIERGIYDTARIEALVADHVDIVANGLNRDNHMMLLWQLVNLELWLRSIEGAA